VKIDGGLKDMSKSWLILSAVLLALCFQTASCTNQSENKMVELGGPNKATELVVFFKKDATHEQIEDFNNKVLSKPHPQGRGYYMLDGIAFQFSLIEAGYKGMGINFSTDATPELKEQLKRSIQQSPIVYKVYENVVPSAVKDLG
jgi:hypothetical protein